MSIFLLIPLAISFTVANRLFSKYTLDKHDIFALTLLTNIVSALLVLPFAWTSLSDVRYFTVSQYVLILMLGILWTVTAWIMNISISLNDFSFKEIIRQTRVIFVVLMGVFFLGETLSFGDVLGIGIIIAAVFLVSTKKISFREHVTSKPLLFAWISSFLVAIITVLEKVVLNSTSALVCAFFAFSIPSIFLLAFMNRKRVGEVKELITKQTRDVVIFGVLMLCAYYFAIATYQALPISIAYPIIQSATIFGVVIGTILFEEKKHLLRKFVAACVVVLALFIMKFF